MAEPPADVTTPAKDSPGHLQDATSVIELPAPPGWKKTLTPKKGGTSRRAEVVFIAPNGEEIRNKKQLNAYLKSNPGEPSSSSFDWTWTTGDTPRRSARLSERMKEAETSPEEGPPKKRGRKSEPKKKEVVSGEEAKPEEDKASDAELVISREEEEGRPVAVEVLAAADNGAEGEVVEDKEKKDEAGVALADSSVDDKPSEKREEGIEELKPASENGVADVEAKEVAAAAPVDDNKSKEGVEGLEQPLEAKEPKLEALENGKTVSGDQPPVPEVAISAPVNGVDNGNH